MGTGFSIFLIALGAILTFAVDATVSGLDLDVVGIILMIAGAIGILVSLMWIDRATGPRRHTVVEEHHSAPTRRVVEERRTL